MTETSKRIKRLVREYGAIAHDRELGQALRDLGAQFERWRSGEISPAELLQHLAGLIDFYEAEQSA